MLVLFHTPTPQRQMRQRVANRARRIIDSPPCNNLTAYHVEYIALRTVNRFEVLKIYSCRSISLNECLQLFRLTFEIDNERVEERIEMIVRCRGRAGQVWHRHYLSIIGWA